MSFGQSAPPATTKQVQYLLSLVQKAGHTGFRDARGPLGLTQRQASGKFSRSEASALIDSLMGAGDADGTEGVALSGEQLSADQQLRLSRLELIRGMPAELLAEDLVRRGWEVSAPD